MSRPLIINGDVAVIVLTQGHRAVIDAADAPLVVGNNWSALISKRRKAVYAVRVKQVDGKQKMILLHRYLLNAPNGVHVDHIDGDGLNCRRLNMRLCTQSENNLNTPMRSDNKSGFKGVSWEAKAKKWRAEIGRAGKVRTLGRFATASEAHAAYTAAALELFGEFARQS